MNYQENKEREAKVLEMIEKNMIVADMARELGITPQSVHKFLKTRGWKAKVKGGSGSYEKDMKLLDPARQARKAARKKINSSVDRSGAGGHKAKTKSKEA